MYWYRVRAYQGSTYSDYTSNVQGTSKLNTPTNLSGTVVSFTQINLSWTDNSSKETNYRIDRAPDNGGVPGTWTVTYGLVGANATSYSDTACSPNTKYWYRVWAWIYPHGVASATSNQISATTPIAPLGAIVTDYWYGTNGSAWSSQWTGDNRVLTGGTASLTIQSNQGPGSVHEDRRQHGRRLHHQQHQQDDGGLGSKRHLLRRQPGTKMLLVARTDANYTNNYMVQGPVRH